MPMSSRYWVFDWLEAHGVSTLEDARRALASPGGVTDLIARAEAARAKPLRPDVADYSLAAGRGIDLSGHLDCNHPSCRQRQVDDLFRHAWHYFDQIIVADSVTHEITAHWDASSEERMEWLLSHIDVLLYLRAIGAERLLLFHEKPIPCERHWRTHAEEAGLAHVVNHLDALAANIQDECSVEGKPADCGHFHYTFNHPRFEHTVWGQIPNVPGISGAELKRQVVESVLGRYVAHFTSDIAVAKVMGSPLGARLWLHGLLLGQATRAATPHLTAFELELPFLRGVPVAELVKLRSDERDAFVRFRAALQAAVKEKAKGREEPTPKALAEEIRRDLIDPALAEISQRLKSAGRLLNRKATVGLELGTLATACGVFAGLAVPIAITGGVAALISVAGSALAKDADERRDTALSDMYFLWRASQERRLGEAARLTPG
jgi:hypothetical protein